MSTTLKKITTRAKAIRKKQPGIQWKTAVKKAGAEYRSGKIGAVRKKRSPVKKKRRVASVTGRVVRKAVGSRPTAVRKSRSIGGTVAHHKSAAKKIVEEQLAWNLLNISQAKTKKSKRKLQQRSAKLKMELRKLS